MTNEQLKHLKTIFYGLSWRKSTDFRAVIMNSKRQVKGKLGHVVQIHVCLLPFAVSDALLQLLVNVYLHCNMLAKRRPIG